MKVIFQNLILSLCPKNEASFGGFCLAVWGILHFVRDKLKLLAKIVEILGLSRIEEDISKRQGHRRRTGGGEGGSSPGRVSQGGRKFPPEDLVILTI